MATTAPAEGNAPSVALAGEDLTVALKAQLEYYFSKSNLARDQYLLSQMDSNKMVKIDVIANFPKVKRLTTDRQVLVKAMTESKQLKVDESKQHVGPVVTGARTTLILRDMPATIPEAEIESIFADQACPKFKSLRSDIDDTWFVTFKSQADCTDAAMFLMGKKFKGKPIRCRVKSENTFRAAAAAAGGYKGPGGRGGGPGADGPRGSGGASTAPFYPPNYGGGYPQPAYNMMYNNPYMGGGVPYQYSPYMYNNLPNQGSGGNDGNYSNNKQDNRGGRNNRNNNHHHNNHHQNNNNHNQNQNQGNSGRKGRKGGSPSGGNQNSSGSKRKNKRNKDNRRGGEGKSGGNTPKNQSPSKVKQPNFNKGDFPALPTSSAGPALSKGKATASAGVSGGYPTSFQQYSREELHAIVESLRAGKENKRPSSMPSDAKMFRKQPIDECQLMEPFPIMYPASPSPLLMPQPDNIVIPDLDLNYSNAVTEGSRRRKSNAGNNRGSNNKGGNNKGNKRGNKGGNKDDRQSSGRGGNKGQNKNNNNRGGSRSNNNNNNNNKNQQSRAQGPNAGGAWGASSSKQGGKVTAASIVAQAEAKALAMARANANKPQQPKRKNDKKQNNSNNNNNNLSTVSANNGNNNTNSNNNNVSGNRSGKPTAADIVKASASKPVTNKRNHDRKERSRGKKNNKSNNSNNNNNQASSTNSNTPSPSSSSSSDASGPSPTKNTSPKEPKKTSFAEVLLRSAIATKPAPQAPAPTAGPKPLNTKPAPKPTPSAAASSSTSSSASSSGPSSSSASSASSSSGDNTAASSTDDAAPAPTKKEDGKESKRA